jgi:hypothetical protein
VEADPQELPWAELGLFEFYYALDVEVFFLPFVVFLVEKYSQGF